MAKTPIGWTDATWNPTTGCTKVSPGCKHCYAETMHKRLTEMGQPKYSEPFSVIRCHEDQLDAPLKWRKPRRIFVNSMSDLFHKDVPFEFVLKVYRVMQRAYWHTYQILTKRSDRLLEFTRWLAGADDISIAEWPRHVWLGVSAENQEQIEKRIPILAQIPAAVRFVSGEPMLGPLDVTPWLLTEIDWVICGGESGPNARPMHPDWARSLRDQCAAAGVPFFFKQWGEWQHGSCKFEKLNRIVLNDGNFAATPDDFADSYIDKWPDYRAEMMAGVGKKAAGNLLDGRRHEEFPAR